MNGKINVENINIETERLLINKWELTDAEDLFAYARVDGVGQAAGWSPHKSVEESKGILLSFIKEKKTLAIRLKDDGRAIGSIGVEELKCERHKRSKKTGRELGYVLSKDFWGKGLMTEAVKAVADYLFKNFGYDFLACGHFPDNKRSKSVIRKCGFKFCAVGKYNGKDVLYYQLKNPYLV